MDNLFLLLFFASFICLIIGLAKPTVYSRFIKDKITRKKIATIFGIATVTSFILFGITTDTSRDDQATQQPTTENTEAVTDNENQDSTPTDVDKSPTPAKTEDKPVPTTPSETVSQKNAVRKAKSYLDYSAFSYGGLIAQLEYEQFSHADAVYGADNSGANWNEQAAKKAKSYMEYSAFSRSGLIDQLKYEKFTQEQAEYGASAVGL